MRNTFAMEKMDFELHDFTRTAWVSLNARTEWEPRIKEARKLWYQLEYLSVVHGIRKCALLTLPPNKLPDISLELLENDLVLLPISVVPKTNSYGTATRTPQTGEEIAHTCVVGRVADVRLFVEFWEKRDDDGIGRLLGYPACCRKFFNDTWNDKGIVDPTWQMIIETDESCEQSAVVEGHSNLNILLRWIGIRSVPHLPCSFHCMESIDFSNSILGLADGIDKNQQKEWLLEILAWPLEWSVLHGIAVIKTPILKICARSVTTTKTFTVRRKSNKYPKLGANGVNFPYQPKKR